MEGDSLSFENLAATVYDRQIRLWGHDTQRRLSKSRVAIAGRLDVLALEIGKNLSLAGVGCIRLFGKGTISSNLVKSVPRSSNYVSAIYDGKSVAMAFKEYFLSLNPAVCVEEHNFDICDPDFNVDQKHIKLFDTDFIIICEPELENLFLLNDLLKLTSAKTIVALSSGLCALATFKWSVVSEFKNAADLFLHGVFPNMEVQRAGGEIVLDANKRFAYIMAAMRAKAFGTKQAKDVNTKSSHIEESESCISSKTLVEILRDFNVTPENRVYSVDETNSLLRKYAGGLASGFLPVCSVIGGYIAQEVVKDIGGSARKSNNVAFFSAKNLSGRLYRFIYPKKSEPKHEK